MLSWIKSVFNKKRYFLVASHGNTATLWLAGMLNEYDEVFCTHSYQYPILSPLQKLVKEAEGANLIENLNKHFWDLSLDEFFDQHAKATDKRIIGNVHAYTLSRIIQLLPGLTKKRKDKLVIVNMIRHPISRINSCYHHWLKGNDEKFPFIQLDIENSCGDLLHFLKIYGHNVDMNYKNRAFIVALLQSIHVAHDVLVAEDYQFANIKFEDAITPYQYTEIFMALTQIKRPKFVNFYANFESDIFKHKHNPDPISDERHQFEKWESWKQNLFRYICTTYSLKKTYKKYDYDLSFVGRHAYKN